MSENNKSLVTESKSFVKEALIISVSNFIVKFIGMLYKIPLATILGESMGVFNSAYSIYAMLFMISTSGLPVAISKMIAGSAKKGRLRETKKIFKMTLYAFGLVGIICSVFLFFFAEPLAIWSIHPDSIIALKVIAPTLFFICITSAYRGYFQGLRNMYPTAISQLIEALIKLSVGLGATVWARSMGYSIQVQVAFAISGLTLGVFLGMVFLIFYKMISNRIRIKNTSDKALRYKAIARRLVIIALPVTITSSMLYLSHFMDTLVIKKALIGSGVTEETANLLFSSYTTLAISISDLLPSTLVYPIAISILPAVAGALALKKRREAVGYIISSIRISGIIALPCSLCLFALSRPCISLIYGVNWGREIVLPNGNIVMPIDVAAPALSILALGIFFISLLSTTNALLQAAGRVYYPMYSVGIGVLLLIIGDITLISIKPIGIFGAPISALLCYITAFYINIRFLKKAQNIKLPAKRLFLKPLVCSLITGIYCYISYRIFYYIWGLVFSSNPESRIASLVILLFTAITAVIFYAFLLLLSKGISASEVRLLPMGNRLSGYFIKKGLLKESVVKANE